MKPLVILCMGAYFSQCARNRGYLCIKRCHFFMAFVPKDLHPLCCIRLDYQCSGDLPYEVCEHWGDDQWDIHSN